MRILKYKISLEGENSIALSIGAEILSIQMQKGSICMWALEDPDATTWVRNFVVYGTGWDIGDNPGKYIGTVQDDIFVWHIFEVEGTIRGC